MQPMPYGSPGSHAVIVFSERELTLTFVYCRPYRPSTCLSSVTFVHRTLSVEILGNVSSSFVDQLYPIALLREKKTQNGFINFKFWWLL